MSTESKQVRILEIKSRLAANQRLVMGNEPSLFRLGVDIADKLLKEELERLESKT